MTELQRDIHEKFRRAEQLVLQVALGTGWRPEDAAEIAQAFVDLGYSAGVDVQIGGSLTRVSPERAISEALKRGIEFQGASSFHLVLPADRSDRVPFDRISPDGRWLLVFDLIADMPNPSAG